MTRPAHITRRRGTVYVIVLITVSLVTLLAISGLTAARIQNRAADAQTDAMRASLIARSAIDLAIHQTYTVAAWRTAAESAPLVGSRAHAGGTLVVNASDPADADLDDSDDDPVLIRATASVGSARRMYDATLDPRFDPIACLSDALVVGGNATFTAITVSAQSIHVGTKCTASSAMIAGHVRAVGSITGSSYLWTKTNTPVAPKLPNAADLAWYEADGTIILISALPGDDLDKCVLSPTSNPFNGRLNPRGIYIIDCAYKNLKIKDCRIVGTLIVRNPGTGWKIEHSVLWEPAVRGFPALIVLGSINPIDLETTPLSESSVNANLNPVGSPYQGVDDSDETDTYTPAITGLIYVTGDATVKAASTLRAPLFVGGNLTVEGALTAAISADSIAYPPPGFRAGSRMVIRHGSIVQVAD